MSEFQESDYSNLMFNVYLATPSQDYRQVFSELRMYGEFSAPLDGLDRQKIIRYIIYAYDKNSPFRVKYKEPLTRKVHAMIQAGYDMNGNRFDQDIEDVLENKNHKVCDMVIAFLKIHSDILYSHLVMLETLYYNKQKQIYLNQGRESIKELESIKEAFEKAQKEFLAEEHSQKLVKSLYQNINKDKVALSPEDVATAIKEDNLIKLLD